MKHNAVLLAGLLIGTCWSNSAPIPETMVRIPAGEFMMGDTFGEGGGSERPVHSIFVSSFYMEKYEVTKALWDEVYNWAIGHGYRFQTWDGYAQGKAANHPVNWITWFDAVKWCNARSEKEGRLPAYYTETAQLNAYRVGEADVQNEWVKWNAGYRLPT